MVAELRRREKEVEFHELKQSVRMAPFNITMGDIRKIEEGG